jgi:galactose-1-phosphate uridylyltransferase
MDLKQLFKFLFNTKDLILSARSKVTLFLSESVKWILYPHQEVHDIKKENIGLIEVIGLAVPGRLRKN